MTTLAAAIARLLPPTAVCAVARISATLPSPFAVEHNAARRMAPGRRAEFFAGRQVARDALTALGVAPVAIGVGSQREPLWPCGVVGSITHTRDHVAVAVAPATTVRGLGIDLHPITPLAPDLVEMVCTSAERARFADNRVAGAVAALAFSAKESVYKVLFPLTRRFWDFHDVEVVFDLDSGQFAVTGATVPVRGHFARVGELYCCAAWTLGHDESSTCNSALADTCRASALLKH